MNGAPEQVHDHHLHAVTTEWERFDDDAPIELLRVASKTFGTEAVRRTIREIGERLPAYRPCFLQLLRLRRQQQILAGAEA